MITIKLNRQTVNGKAVRGKLVIPMDGKLNEFPSLENAEYIIPAGTYGMDRTYSKKFKKLLPIIENVPNRVGIRIHTGSVPEHTHGCVLTNLNAMSYLSVIFNRVMLFNNEKGENEEDEKVYIEISDPVSDCA